VICLDVREVLPELAVGVLAPEERDEAERHLRWCAGCRKESEELSRAAATLGFALDPARPPHGLEERVVERVASAAGNGKGLRRAKTAAASIAAAMVAISGLGWGAVMAGRAERLQDRAALAEARWFEAIEDFQKIVNAPIPVRELTQESAQIGTLRATAAGQGGGAVLQLVSPTMIDFTIVIVNGLDPEATGRLPYRVQLLNEAGEALKGGSIDELDADGGAEVFHEFRQRDLTGFTTVQVVDAQGTVVLVGEVGRT
jgi:hypothetical protein